MLTSLARFDGRSTLETRTFGIALNVCRETRRREMRRGTSSFDPDNEPATDARAAFSNGADSNRADGRGEDRLERLDDAAALRDVRAALPARQREAVTLRYSGEMSVQQAAGAMACAAGTVKATLFAALRNLKRRIEPRPREDKPRQDTPRQDTSSGPAEGG